MKTFKIKVISEFTIEATNRSEAGYIVTEMMKDELESNAKVYINGKEDEIRKGVEEFLASLEDWYAIIKV